MAEWDIPNWITLIVEVAIALFAVGISWKFYNKGKEQQETIQKIETEQTNLIREMKPIIEKQGKILEEQEKKERQRKQNVLDVIAHQLKGAKMFIDNSENWKKNPSPHTPLIEFLKIESDSLKQVSDIIRPYTGKETEWIPSPLNDKIASASDESFQYARTLVETGPVSEKFKEIFGEVNSETANKKIDDAIKAISEFKLPD